MVSVQHFALTAAPSDPRQGKGNHQESDYGWSTEKEIVTKEKGRVVAWYQGRVRRGEGVRRQFVARGKYREQYYIV